MHTYKLQAMCLEHFSLVCQTSSFMPLSIRAIMIQDMSQMSPLSLVPSKVSTELKAENSTGDGLVNVTYMFLNDQAQHHMWGMKFD